MANWGFDGKEKVVSKMSDLTENEEVKTSKWAQWFRAGCYFLLGAFVGNIRIVKSKD